VLPAPQAQLRVSQQMAEEETAEWRQQKELIVRPQPLSARAFCSSFLPSLLSWKSISVKLLFVRRCSLLRFWVSRRSAVERLSRGCRFSLLPVVTGEVRAKGFDGF